MFLRILCVLFLHSKQENKNKTKATQKQHKNKTKNKQLHLFRMWIQVVNQIWVFVQGYTFDNNNKY